MYLDNTPIAYQVGQWVLSAFLREMIQFPISIEVDITGRCNYRCIYCRNGDMMPFGDMDYDVLVKLLNECKSNNIFSISLSGGEPTLHKRFYDIVRYVGPMEIPWSLTTNGYNIDKQLAECLSKNNVQSIFITLTGFSDRTEEEYKGVSNCFSRVMNAIKICLASNLPITLGYLLTHRNLSEFTHFVHFCQMYGIRAKIMKAEPLGNAARNANFLSVSEDEYMHAMAYAICVLGEKVVAGEHDMPFEKRICTAGVISCVVGFDGNVYPCVNFLGNKETVCGSIKNSTLKDIWNTSIVLRNFRCPRVYAPYCNDCIMRESCGGGCRAEAYRKTGNYKIVESPCNIHTDLSIHHKSE